MFLKTQEERFIEFDTFRSFKQNVNVLQLLQN